MNQPILSRSEIRSGLTNIVILSAAIIDVIALVGSVLRAREIGVQNVMYLQGMIAILVVTIYLFRHHLSVNKRAHAICACYFFAGATGLIGFGLAGTATLIMAGACIAASLLINIRAALIYALLGAAVIVSQLVLAMMGELRYTLEIWDYLLSPAAWINNLIVFSYVVGISLLLIHKFSQYLSALLAQQTEHIASQSEQICQTESLLDVVINALPFGILWKDYDLRYVGANQYFLNDIEVEHLADIIGKTDFEFMPEPIAQRFYALDQQVLGQNDEAVHYEEKYLNSQGQTKYNEVIRLPLKSPDGQPLGILAAYYDITQKTKMQMELREAKRSAEQATLAKSQFLANMSHEIRTPLNGILGLLDLSLDTDLNSTQLSYLRKANLSAKTLLNIINDILDISKIEAGELHIESIPFSLSQILDHVVSQFTHEAQAKNIEFSLIYSGPDEPWVEGDPTRLFQILINLCANAIKFTEKGSVELHCHVQTAQQDMHLEFKVIDTGTGIKQDVLPKLFNNFTQADSSITRKFGGTGLGLAIVKALVTKMSGKIEATSKIGHGSCFIVTLSLPLGQAKVSQEISEKQVSLQNKRILLVEDNAINQMIAQEILLVTGAQVECAENGQVALDKLQAQDFDLVLMDIQMPVMDGCQAMGQIRAQAKWQALPVIALTANAMLHDIEKYQTLGFNAHVAKPFERSHLLQVVANQLDKAG